MTDTPETTTPAPGKPPLDIGKVIGDVFSIYFKTLPVFFLIIFVPYFGFDFAINQWVQTAIQSGSPDLFQLFISQSLIRKDSIIISTMSNPGTFK